MVWSSVRGGRRRGQPEEVRVLGRAGRHRGGALAELPQGVGRGLIAGGHGDARSHCRAHAHLDVPFGDVLMDLVGGIAGQPGVFGHEHDFGFVGSRRQGGTHGFGGQLQGPLPAEHQRVAAHRRGTAVPGLRAAHRLLSHRDAAETGRSHSVADVDGLPGFALAAVRGAQQPPLGVAADRVAAAPERRGHARIGALPQHPAQHPILDLPPDLGSEVEVQAPVVDAPALVGAHQDAVGGVGDEFVERALPRLQVDVRHADEGDAVPSGGAHGPAGLLLEKGAGLSGGEEAGQPAALHQRDALRRHALVVEGSGAESPGAGGVGHDGHQVGTVAQVVPVGRGQEAGARVAGFAAEDAVEFRGVSHRLVHLYRHLIGVKNEGGVTRRTHRRREQGHRFLAETGRVAGQVEGPDGLETALGPAAQAGRGIRTGLHVAGDHRHRGDAPAGLGARLADQGSLGGREHLLFAHGAQGPHRERDPGMVQGLGGGQQVLDLGFGAEREGVLDAGPRHVGHERPLRREADLLPAHHRRRPGHGDGLRRRAGGLVRGQLVRGGETPEPVHEHPHPEAEFLLVGPGLQGAVLHLEVLRAPKHDADVAVVDAGLVEEREHREGEVFHGPILPRGVEARPDLQRAAPSPDLDSGRASGAGGVGAAGSDVESRLGGRLPGSNGRLGVSGRSLGHGRRLGHGRAPRAQRARRAQALGWRGSATGSGAAADRPPAGTPPDSLPRGTAPARYCPAGYGPAGYGRGGDMVRPDTGPSGRAEQSAPVPAERRAAPGSSPTGGSR